MRNEKALTKEQAEVFFRSAKPMVSAGFLHIMTTREKMRVGCASEAVFVEKFVPKASRRGGIIWEGVEFYPDLAQFAKAYGVVDH